jgi:hypothetical protein
MSSMLHEDRNNCYYQSIADMNHDVDCKTKISGDFVTVVIIVEVNAEYQKESKWIEQSVSDSLLLSDCVSRSRRF